MEESERVLRMNEDYIQEERAKVIRQSDIMNKVKEWLRDEVEQYKKYEDDIGDVDSFDDGILKGRLECAECLLEQIDKWENEE